MTSRPYARRRNRFTSTENCLYVLYAGVHDDAKLASVPIPTVCESALLFLKASGRWFSAAAVTDHEKNTTCQRIILEF